jgi:replicative DNA helicase
MFTYSMATDPVTVLEQMRVHGVWTETSASYLLELVNITPTSANVMEYAAIVRDTALLRAIADSGNDIVNMALDGEGGAATILEAAEKKNLRAAAGPATSASEAESQRSCSTSTDRLAGSLEKRQPYSGLQSEAGGRGPEDHGPQQLRPYPHRLIAPRHGQNEHRAQHRDARGQDVRKIGSPFFSLEMSREQLALRLLSSESFIDGKNCCSPGS